MIIPTNPTSDVEPTASSEQPYRIVLVRYGLVPQVARFGVSKTIFEEHGEQLIHGATVVVDSDRGPEIGTHLEVVREGLVESEVSITGPLTRIATDEDLTLHADHRRQCELNFFDWQQRIDDWQLKLQLIDLEQTLDPEKIILYVLNGQDAETTRLALLAAAAGLGIIHVQPVSADGIVQQTSGGGCGSGGCGSGGCSS